jgi:hypothetical protein
MIILSGGHITNKPGLAQWYCTFLQHYTGANQQFSSSFISNKANIGYFNNNRTIRDALKPIP